MCTTRCKVAQLEMISALCLYHRNIIAPIMIYIYIQYVYNHVTLQNQLLSLGAILSMKTPKLKHEMIVSPQLNYFFHNSSVSFSSTFHIKPLQAKALHKNTQQEEVHPIALGTALQYNLDFISRYKRLFDIPHHKWNIFCVLLDRLVRALWFDSRVPLLHLYAKHTDEAATYH